MDIEKIHKLLEAITSDLARGKNPEDIIEKFVSELEPGEDLPKALKEFFYTNYEANQYFLKVFRRMVEDKSWGKFTIEKADIRQWEYPWVGGPCAYLVLVNTHNDGTGHRIFFTFTPSDEVVVFQYVKRQKRC